jgi:hypothetical protein
MTWLPILSNLRIVDQACHSSNDCVRQRSGWSDSHGILQIHTRLGNESIPVREQWFSHGGVCGTLPEAGPKTPKPTEDRLWVAFAATASQLQLGDTEGADGVNRAHHRDDEMASGDPAPHRSYLLT